MAIDCSQSSIIRNSYLLRRGCCYCGSWLEEESAGERGGIGGRGGEKDATTGGATAGGANDEEDLTSLTLPNRSVSPDPRLLLVSVAMLETDAALSVLLCSFTPVLPLPELPPGTGRIGGPIVNVLEVLASGSSAETSWTIDFGFPCNVGGTRVDEASGWTSRTMFSLPSTSFSTTCSSLGTTFSSSFSSPSFITTSPSPTLSLLGNAGGTLKLGLTDIGSALRGGGQVGADGTLLTGVALPFTPVAGDLTLLTLPVVLATLLTLVLDTFRLLMRITRSLHADRVDKPLEAILNDVIISVLSVALDSVETGLLAEDETENMDTREDGLEVLGGPVRLVEVVVVTLDLVLPRELGLREGENGEVTLLKVDFVLEVDVIGVWDLTDGVMLLEADLEVGVEVERDSAPLRILAREDTLTRLRPILNHPHTSKIDTESEAGSNMRVSVLSRSIGGAMPARSARTTGGSAARSVHSLASSLMSRESERTVSTARHPGHHVHGTGHSHGNGNNGGMSPAKQLAADVHAGRARSLSGGSGSMKDRSSSSSFRQPSIIEPHQEEEDDYGDWESRDVTIEDGDGDKDSLTGGDYGDEEDKSDVGDGRSVGEEEARQTDRPRLAMPVRCTTPLARSRRPSSPAPVRDYGRMQRQSWVDVVYWKVKMMKATQSRD
ncbi:hypothetical protein CPB84DRAFT_1751808 [Gymnopilus junonius]|uniref:Uncharacterized protein n=1 Tax=Gymnopilus junonius TaxID=109634 RepID=A0A9P5NCY4_GYMJU|nr:hypothetical protein CPB84DRAFT_1751808 [Gymnopilus junonius]